MLISSVWRDWARAFFILGLLLGGLFVGGVLATANSILFAWWVPTNLHPWIPVGLFLLALMVDLRILPLRVPQNARQVPEKVQLRGPRYGALQFGFEMGTGLRTFMTSVLPHAVGLCGLMFLPTSYALIAGLGFGVGRSVVPLARAIPGNEPDWTLAFDGSARAVRTILGVSLFAAAILSLR